MDHSIKRKMLACFSILVSILAVLPTAYGQAAPTASAEEIQALQKKLDALQSQMSEVQGELQRLSGTSGPPPPPPREVTDLKSEIQAEQKSETSQVETELTPKKIELGKTTVTYRIFSQDPFAAPRINNEPLDPRFPGYFRLFGTNTLLRIGGYAADFIYDLKPAGNVDSFIPATIPIPAPTSINNSTISVRATRLNLDFLVPTKSGDSYRFFLEMDFFGTNATTPKLRHASARRRTSWSARPSRTSWILTLGRMGWTTRESMPGFRSATHSFATACLWQRRPPSASRPRSRLRTYFLRPRRRRRSRRARLLTEL